MARKRCKPDEIVGKLSKTDVLHGQGMYMTEAIGQLGISEPTFYRGGQGQADHASLAESPGSRELL